MLTWRCFKAEDNFLSCLVLNNEELRRGVGTGSDDSIFPKVYLEKWFSEVSYFKACLPETLLQLS